MEKKTCPSCNHDGYIKIFENVNDYIYKCTLCSTNYKDKLHKGVHMNREILKKELEKEFENYSFVFEENQIVITKGFLEKKVRMFYEFESALDNENFSAMEEVLMNAIKDVIRKNIRIYFEK